MKGVQRLIEEEEGVGLTFSVSVSEERGFGLKLLQIEVDKVCNHPSWVNRSKLKFDEKTPYGSPGLISFGAD